MEYSKQDIDLPLGSDTETDVQFRWDGEICFNINVTSFNNKTFFTATTLPIDGTESTTAILLIEDPKA